MWNTDWAASVPFSLNFIDLLSFCDPAPPQLHLILARQRSWSKSPSASSFFLLGSASSKSNHRIVYYSISVFQWILFTYSKWALLTEMAFTEQGRSCWVWGYLYCTGKSRQERLKSIKANKVKIAGKATAANKATENIYFFISLWMFICTHEHFHLLEF